MNVIECNLTYFECVSRSIKDTTGKQVHDALLFYLMKIVFSNAEYSTFQDFCSDIKANQTKHVQLNPSLVHNNAVKQWIKRFAQKERAVAHTPDVWFVEYPKLLKGVMLRFFYWHRDYANKPHRIYCKYVFSHLVADFYNCSVGIVEEGGENAYGVRWFYPLGARDYYQFDNILQCIVIRQDSKDGSFALLQPPETVKAQGTTLPLLLQSQDSSEEEEEEETMSYPRFVLRISRELKLSNGQKSRSNEKIAELREQKGQVYWCGLNGVQKGSIYQIFPGNPNRCFFDMGLCESMIIYCIDKNKKAVICATHSSNEQYPYFSLLPDTQSIVVVIAKNIPESEEALKNHTDYKLNK